ncbi:MAG: ATP-binding protein [Blautia sp.]|nr:ATP-binding protein [Lachnoclostridium sp.]MCM1212534.1 ATP-binding protein [Blautia sp.]
MAGSDLNYILMQFVTYVSETLFFYFWLRAFSEKKFRNNKVVLMALLCLAALRYYGDSFGNVAFGMIFGLGCSLLCAFWLFHDRQVRLFFYVAANEVIVVSADVLFQASWICLSGGNPMGGTSGGLLLLLMERCLLFFLYGILIKTASRGKSFVVKSQTDLPFSLLLCAVVAVSYIFMVGICVLGAGAAAEGQVGWLMAGSLVSLTVSVAMVCLFGRLTDIYEKIHHLELQGIRFRLEEKHYREMEEVHEQYDVFLHDIRHLMRTITVLSKEENFEEIEHLVMEKREYLRNLEQNAVCSHKILNALLMERKEYADSQNVSLLLEIKEPLFTQEIDDLDLITLMGNLLDNAIEAEKHATKQEGILCQMRMAREGRHIVIQVENSFQGKAPEEGHVPRKRGQIGDKHGIGLESVQESVKKYGGIMECSKTGDRYRVKILLPVSGGQESVIA